MLYKNTASQKVYFYAFDATTGLPKTGDAANITAYGALDYGSVTVLGDTSATEIDATNAKGYYLFDLTQAETNANRILFSAKSTTSNVVVIGAPSMVWTQPTGFQAQVAQTGDNYARIGAPAGASVSADIAAAKVDTAAIKVKTDNLPASPAAVGSAMTLTSGERDSIATALLKLDFTGITGEAARSMLNALRFLRNKWSISGTTLTVTKEDDSTSAWTSVVTATAGADPITGNDPT